MGARTLLGLWSVTNSPLSAWLWFEQVRPWGFSPEGCCCRLSTAFPRHLGTFGKWALWSQHVPRRALKVLQFHLSLPRSQLDEPGHSTCKIISWNFKSLVFKVRKLSSSTAEYRAWRELLKNFSMVLVPSPPPVYNSSLMSVWSHLVLMGRIDCISLFARVLLLRSSTECSIAFSIAPSQKTEIIPKKP